MNYYYKQNKFWEKKKRFNWGLIGSCLFAFAIWAWIIWKAVDIYFE